ncbi:MAG: hypothetical protein J5517_08920 [Eubacterium sp.]|nr:hypothetical protein [Eubacterium sp.]
MIINSARIIKTKAVKHITSFENPNVLDESNVSIFDGISEKAKNTAHITEAFTTLLSILREKAF